MADKKEDTEFDISRLVEVDKNPLYRESDRGCVLLLAADIENVLEKIFEAWFKGVGTLSKKIQKDVFDFTGPLGTFSAKITLSRALGIIESKLYSDLQKIRKIRNHAAHSNDDFSLSDPEMKEIVSSMNNQHRGAITRYSFNDSPDKKETENTETNESFMKGFGLLRADKVDFIIAAKTVQSWLELMVPMAPAMGNSAAQIRVEVDTWTKRYFEKKE